MLPKLSRDLRWLHPYIEAVEGLIDVARINEIKSVKFRTALPDHDAIIEDLGKRGFKIIVRPYQPIENRLPISKLDQDTILQNLAHEFSHIGVWEEHDPKRVILQAKILARFAKKLKQLGYEKDRNKVK